MRQFVLPALIASLLLVATCPAASLSVVSVAPAPNALTAPVTTSIAVTFDRPLDPGTVDASSFWAFGRWTGTIAGPLSVSGDGLTATLIPARAFTAGDLVTVFLSHDLGGADGSPMRPGGYSFQFWTAAAPAPRVFEEVIVLDTRTTPGESSRAYGGIATDLDGDGHLDLTTVNEDTADLRTFMSLGAAPDAFTDFLQPTTPIGNRASPSEPCDFDRDGIPDVCVCAINDNDVSVVLGVGDGTFHPRQVIPVGSAPRGIAALDVDGDGDADIVNTNSGSNTLTLMLNDGTGAFGAPIDVPGGGSDEWALATADMNEDGLLDLVVGNRSSGSVVVLTANGDATFSVASTRSGVGAVWMLVCGDVNGDGHVDVATANSGNNHAAILLGDGNGGLGAPAFSATDPFPLATDLADLDGDGDLDWINSSFSGDWSVFVNDGAGNFTFDQEFDAPAAASCALAFDADNDGDLDLGLIDELADVVRVMRNGSAACTGDVDGDFVVGFSDLLALLALWGPCPAPCGADFDDDGTVGFADLLTVLGAWGDC